jgi:hypothetical protein
MESVSDGIEFGDPDEHAAELGSQGGGRRRAPRGGYDASMTPVRRLAPGWLGIAFVVAACGSGAASSAPTQSGGASSATSEPPVASAGEPSPVGSLAPQAGQTDTDWGRIWDTLPSAFPTVNGATPGEETATGPATANLVIDGVDAKGITNELETLLKQAGYTTAALSGPLENGGYVLEMNGSMAGCQLQVTAAPTGSLTTLTILYGSGCPHD